MGLLRVRLDDATHARLKVYAAQKQLPRLEDATNELLREALDRAGVRLSR